MKNSSTPNRFNSNSRLLLGSAVETAASNTSPPGGALSAHMAFNHCPSGTPTPTPTPEFHSYADREPRLQERLQSHGHVRHPHLARHLKFCRGLRTVILAREEIKVLPARC